MKIAILSALAVGAAATASGASEYITSTVYTTSVYTVTSCAPTVTDCPAKMGAMTTEVVPLYTTVCPVSSTEAHPPPPTMKTDSAIPPPPKMTETSEAEMMTSTVYLTQECTITFCEPAVTNCPVGMKTQTVLTTTTICPVSDTAAPIPPAMSTPGAGGAGNGAPMPMPTPAPASSAGRNDNGVLSTITYSGCVPTTVTSITTMPAAPAASAPGAPGSGTGAPDAGAGNGAPGAGNGTPGSGIPGAGAPGAGTGSSAPAANVPSAAATATQTQTLISVPMTSSTGPKNATQPYLTVTGAASIQKATGMMVLVGALLAFFW